MRHPTIPARESIWDHNFKENIYVIVSMFEMPETRARAEALQDEADCYS